MSCYLDCQHNSPLAQLVDQFRRVLLPDWRLRTPIFGYPKKRQSNYLTLELRDLLNWDIFATLWA